MASMQDDVTRKAKAGAETLGDDAKKFGSDAQSVGSSIGSSIQSGMSGQAGIGGHESGIDMDRMGEEIKHRAQDMMSTAKVKGTETMQQLQTQVRNKPATALGIAAGVGLLVGLVMAGRR